MIEFPALTPTRVDNQARGVAPASEDPALRELAQKFETAFLSEMLRHSGLGKMPDGFNGGSGEARFSGFLIEAYAEKLSQSGQIGLADRLYKDLAARGGA